MLNITKLSVIFLTFALVVFLPKVSYAYSHHRHGHHYHANPDLTLVTGMDNIDSRVLIAGDPDPAPDP